MNIETNGIKVDSSQLDVVEKFAQELQEFLALWDISHESTNRETARKIAATNPNTVFSLIPDWDTNGGYWKLSLPHESLTSGGKVTNRSLIFPRQSSMKCLPA